MTSKSPSARKAVFLDRDGLLIEYIPYLSSPEQVRLRQEILPFLRQCTQEGVPLVVVSNQSGVGRGFFSEAELERVSKNIGSLLETEEVQITSFFHCTAAPSEGEGRWNPKDMRRKPNPGMFWEAQETLNIDLKHSIVLGDRVADGVAGHRAGLSQALLVNDKQKYANEFEELETTCQGLKIPRDFFKVFSELSAMSDFLSCDPIF